MLRVTALSNCERVELKLNGRSLGKRALKGGTSAVFDVKYQAGELKAVGFRHGVAVATNRLVSASAPVAIRLETDRGVLPADGRSIARVIASVVDKNGNVVYPAGDLLSASVEGAGRLLGVDNGDLMDTTALASPTKHVKDGWALVLVQATDATGEIMVRVEAPGLKGARLLLRSQTVQQ